MKEIGDVFETKWGKGLLWAGWKGVSENVTGDFRT